MSKIDFKREYKNLYKPSPKGFSQVDVPEMQFLMIDGRGDPNSEPYQQAVEALYAAAYKVKFMSKREYGRDYVVPPLEGLWGSEIMVDTLGQATDEQDWLERFQNSDRDAWEWTSCIMQPDWIDGNLLSSSIAEVKEKKGLPMLDEIRLERFNEGLSVQIMHVGSYADEGPILANLHMKFLPENDLVEAGRHHEIYLSDPRRVPPEKLKTVLRQPVKKLMGASHSSRENPI